MLLPLRPCSNAVSLQWVASCCRLSYRDSSDRPWPVASATGRVLLPPPLFPPTDALHMPSSSEQQQQLRQDPTLTMENAHLFAIHAQCRNVLWRESLILTRHCTSDLSFPTTSAPASPPSIIEEGDTMDTRADHAALRIHTGEGDTTDAGAEPAVRGHAGLGWHRCIRADNEAVAPRFMEMPEESAHPWCRWATAAARLLPGDSEGA
jgi:hypothetical protein